MHYSLELIDSLLSLGACVSDRSKADMPNRKIGQGAAVAISISPTKITQLFAQTMFLKTHCHCVMIFE